MVKIYLFFFFLSQFLNWETKDKLGTKILQINQSDYDKFLLEFEDRALLQLHKEFDEDYVKKIIKIFKGYFIIFEV